MGRNRLIIGLPLLVSLLFAFGYLHVQCQSQQRLLQAEQAQHHRTTAARPDLHLITQPTLPTLNQATDNSSAETLGATAVGPSPTNAGTTLQSTAQDKGNNDNAQLQATRKVYKLDELNL